MRNVVFCLVMCLSGCPSTGFPGRYTIADVTAYKPIESKAQRTPGGIAYWAPGGIDVRVKVDRYTAELEKCLMQPIHRSWFAVFIPEDAYVSKCSGQWLVPSTPDCNLCINQKELPLDKRCCGLRKPTAECPCVCNMRSVVQVRGYQVPLIVTTKTLALFKAELSRLVTGVNYPWGDKRISKCLSQE